MTGEVLDVRGLRVDLADGVRAVRGVSYSVGGGEVLGIVGESGAGKSASALAVMGLLPRGARCRGSVRLRGRELIGLGDRELAAVRGRDIAMIFQDPLSALSPVRTVGGQIAETIRAHDNVTRRSAAERAGALLELTGLAEPGRIARAFPHELSGGQRQRVLIATAIANGPDVIIADEPASALDALAQAQIVEVLRAAQEATGAALVLITHDLAMAAGMADRILVMYAGRVVESGPTEAVYHRPRAPYTAGLLGSVPWPTGDGLPSPVPGTPPSPDARPPGCPFEPRCPVAVAVCRTVEPPLVPAGGEHRAACFRAGTRVPPSGVRPGRPMPGDRVVLEVAGLARRYRTATTAAVDGVELHLREAEALAVAGESGSGKTTLLTEILRMSAPQAGRIVLFGRDTAALTRRRRRALRRDVQMVFQDSLAAFDPGMTVAGIVAEPLRAHGWRRADARERVHELLGLVGVASALAGRLPGALSGGQRQRVAIARALALRPRLLLLDEPCSALDASARADLLGLLADLRVRFGLAYLLVTHDLALVRHVADRIAVMHRGRIVETGEVASVFGAPAHPYTRALLSAAAPPYPRTPGPAGSATGPTMAHQGAAAAAPGRAGSPEGCRFRPRCPVYARLDGPEQARCRVAEAVLRPAGGHLTACHRRGV